MTYVAFSSEEKAVAFELHSLASGGSVAARLTGDATGLDRTRAAMRRAIELPAAAETS